MRRGNFTLVTALVALVPFLFLLFYLGYKTFDYQQRTPNRSDDTKKYDERYGGHEEGVSYEWEYQDPDQVGGYAGPGVVDKDPHAEWI